MSMKTDREILLDINNDLGEVKKSISSLDKIAAIQTEQLKTHIKRTDLAEKRLDKFEEEVKPALDAYKFVAIILKLILPFLAGLEFYLRYFKE